MTDLLELALADPDTAWAQAEAILAHTRDPEQLSLAYQARGIVRRDAGDAPQAVVDLRKALRYAERVGPQRLADVRATYGLTLFLAGSTRAGLRALDRAAAESSGEVWAKVLMRRAWVLTFLGRQEAALTDMLLALDGLRGRGSPTWEARTLTTLGHIQQTLGLVQDAERSLVEAERVFRAAGYADEAAIALHNLGTVSYTRGDIPRALEIYDQVHPSDVSDGRVSLGLATNHCDAYLAAGLTAEAVRMFEQLKDDLALPPSMQADLSLSLANVHLADGDPVAALAEAVHASKEFRRQHRPWFELRARLLEVRARYEMGEWSGLSQSAREVARRLDEEKADEAPTALVVAGHLAAGPERAALWRAAAAYASRPNALVRASALLGAALEHEQTRRTGRALRACGRGLDALDEHRATLGSSELRALATSHGRELARLALRHAAGDPRRLLHWSERWRATALAEPPLSPEGEVSPDLAALRDNGRRLARARAESEPLDQLEAERTRLERAVRAEHHRRAGREVGASERFDVDRLVGEVGDGTLVELVDVDGTLHVLVVHDGKVRRRVAGSTEAALELAERARSALRRAARGRPYDPGDLGARLQETLLGSALNLLPDGPLVITPTGRLHAVPWSLLPALADRLFSIVPSAAQWLRAKAVDEPRRHEVLLLAAPGLGSGGSEVPRLARRQPGATVLRGEKATVEAAMAGLDGASLAHVAAHGHFRQDSPLFSSLEMADGPLSVYDLERLRRAPYRLILSACESGVLAPVGADELLGLASALFSMGTAGLVCSIAEVNDEATAALMLDLHDHLVAHPGQGLGGALLAARRAAQGDPTRKATAAAFLALGV